MILHKIIAFKNGYGISLVRSGRNTMYSCQQIKFHNDDTMSYHGLAGTTCSLKWGDVKLLMSKVRNMPACIEGIGKDRKFNGYWHGKKV